MVNTCDATHVVDTLSQQMLSWLENSHGPGRSGTREVGCVSITIRLAAYKPLRGGADYFLDLEAGVDDDHDDVDDESSDDTGNQRHRKRRRRRRGRASDPSSSQNSNQAGLEESQVPKLPEHLAKKEATVCLTTDACFLTDVGPWRSSQLYITPSRIHIVFRSTSGCEPRMRATRLWFWTAFRFLCAPKT